MSNLTGLSFTKTHKSDARMIRSASGVSHHAAVRPGLVFHHTKKLFNRRLDAGHTSFKLP